MNKLVVERKKIEKICKSLKERKVEEVSFEFLIGSCFPHALDNIKEEMRRQHALGYAEGIKENEK